MSATKLSKILVTGAVFSMALVGYLSVLSGAALAEGEAVFASPERSQAAIGHYARARAMLVEALAEFEEARRVARPDMLLDPEEWRLSVISRTEELNRVLDPQPRVTRSGVKYKANKLLIRRERDRLPAVMEGAQDANSYGPEKHSSEQGIAPTSELDQLPAAAGVRARLGNEEEKKSPIATVTPAIEPVNPAPEITKSTDSPSSDPVRTEVLTNDAVTAGETKVEEAKPVETKTESGEGMQVDEGESAIGKEVTTKSAEELDESEESQAISQAIQERLKRLDQMKAATDN